MGGAGGELSQQTWGWWEQDSDLLLPAVSPGRWGGWAGGLGSGTGAALEEGGQMQRGGGALPRPPFLCCTGTRPLVTDSVGRSERELFNSHSAVTGPPRGPRAGYPPPPCLPASGALLLLSTHSGFRAE